jgi:hypothetical protein
MILMITAIELKRNPDTNSSFYPHYWPLLKQWALYLTTALPDPGNQVLLLVLAKWATFDS